MTLTDGIASGDWVGDAKILDLNKEEVPILSLQEEKSIRSVWLHFISNAARINIDATSAVLKVFEPLEYLQGYPPDNV